MAKIEQMDYLAMNLGVNKIGCTPCSVYSVISFGVQSFHLFVDDEERHTTSTLAEMITWYWHENSWHYSEWKTLVEIFRDNGEAMYMKDERSVYLSDGCVDKYIGKVYQLAYYFDSVQDFNSTSLEDFLGTDDE